MIDRRSVLAGLAGVTVGAMSAGRASAVEASAGGEAFSFDFLAERMRALASRPYLPPADDLPATLAGLSYDEYLAISFRPKRTLWRDEGAPFQLQAFYPGYLYRTPVRVFAVEGGRAAELRFTGDDFEFWSPLDRKLAHLDLPGVAGMRLLHPLNAPGVYDELVSFLGASYFRALGRGSLYGLSARGLAIDTATERPEEFPRFTEFYVERPTPGADALTVWAALEGESVAGAYEFRVKPGRDTAMDVTARLFFRSSVGQLGLAPLTSMYLFGENERARFDDFRPEVHDSDGLALVRADGERVWRPLTNPLSLARSAFAEENPRGFGLLQRDRSFENYQDAGARYDRRPSLWIEPIGDWGRGTVHLVELPTPTEVSDNIVAFWTPEARPRAGGELEFRYRMSWGDGLPESPSLAAVVATRTGVAGISGSPGREDTRKFVIDFEGGDLAELAADAPVRRMARAGNGARILASNIVRLPDSHIWRLVLDVRRYDTAPVELTARLMLSGRSLSETWLYRWSS